MIIKLSDLELNDILQNGTDQYVIKKIKHSGHSVRISLQNKQNQYMHTGLHYNEIEINITFIKLIKYKISNWRKKLE